MNYPLVPLTNYGRFRAFIYRTLKKPYLVIALIAYCFVGLLILAYLASPPQYASDMELVLPGTGNSSSVSLDDVGQVVSQTSAPFASGGFNPRVNYKEMLSSRGVRQRAAKSLELSPEEFGQAKIKLTEQTSILLVSINAGSEDLANKKAWALYESLQTELDKLREDEVKRRDKSIQKVLDQYRARMNEKRLAIVEFQQRSVLVSVEQLTQLITTLSGMNERQLYVRSEVSRLDTYINQLSKNLGVSPGTAGQAFILQSDVEFRAYLTELNVTTTHLTEFGAVWGENHPQVLAQQKRLSNTKAAIRQRSEEILGFNSNQLFDGLNLELNPKRAQLFADLIDAFANKEGQVSLRSELERAIAQVSDQVKVFSRESIELERIQREFNMAEAVFTSAAANLEASKADVFASYPVLQMLTIPSYPTVQSSPKPLIAAVVAFVGFFMITFGLVVLWQRNNIIQILLKKD
jgi:uncharacterized protein involved in exopolysaccharide biosynthesis